MKDVRISVIVPLYNVEPHLHRSVDSLLRQDITEPYEIVLVDDGSTDGSPAICDRYAKAYPDLVRVIHKENGGPSEARNQGIAAARGAYICYVDSDDRVTENYLSSLYDALVREGADMAIGGFQLEIPQPDGSFRRKSIIETMPPKRMTRDEALEELCYERFFPGYAVCKLIPRKIAAAEPFPVGRIFEDTGTVYRYILDCQTVAYTPEATYLYQRRPGSILQRPFERRYLDLVFFSAEAEERFRAEGLPESVLSAAAYKLCRACYSSIFHAAATLPLGEFLSMYEALAPYYERSLPAALAQPTTGAWRRFMFRVARRPRLIYVLVRLKGR